MREEENLSQKQNISVVLPSRQRIYLSHGGKRLKTKTKGHLGCRTMLYATCDDDVIIIYHLLHVYVNVGEQTRVQKI